MTIEKANSYLYTRRCKNSIALPMGGEAVMRRYDSNPKSLNQLKTFSHDARIMEHEVDKRMSFSEKYLFGFESDMTAPGKINTTLATENRRRATSQVELSTYWAAPSDRLS